MPAIADSWGPFDLCGRCRRYDWLGRHTCPPIWYVREKGQEDGWPHYFHAWDAEEAAEVAAEAWDGDDGDYDVAYGKRELAVEVTDNPNGGEVKLFRVQGELKPTYTAEDLSE